MRAHRYADVLPSLAVAVPNNTTKDSRRAKNRASQTLHEMLMAPNYLSAHHNTLSKFPRSLLNGKKDFEHKNVTIHKNVPNFFTLKVRCDTLFLDNDVPIFSTFWSDVIANIVYLRSDLANKRYQLIRERHLLKLRNSLNSTCLRQFEKITYDDIEIRSRCNIMIFYLPTYRTGAGGADGLIPSF